MNIRSVTFDLIAQDVALRAFRVTDAVRVHPAHSTGSTAPESCFIELEWAMGERMVAPDGSLFLTVRAHLPCRRSAEHLLLDFLLQRVQMVLAAGAADGLIRSWYQGTLRDVAKSGSDTIFKSSTFQIAPGLPQREREAMTQFCPTPWTGYVDLDSTASGGPTAMS
jgi:hypothetical protein